jgi:hypothetical protein
MKPTHPIKPGRLIYHISQDVRGDYVVTHLNIAVAKLYNNNLPFLKLRFQATKSEVKEDGALLYYGCSADGEHCTPDAFIGMGALMAKLVRQHGKKRDRPISDPMQWAITLDELKAEQVMYCRRHSEYVTLSTYKGPEWKAWRDDWETMNSSSGCYWGCVARDEDEARAMLILEARNGDLIRSTRNEYFEAWKAAGFPVKQLDEYYDYVAPTEWRHVRFLGGKAKAVAAADVKEVAA